MYIFTLKTNAKLNELKPKTYVHESEFFSLFYFLFHKSGDDEGVVLRERGA